MHGSTSLTTSVLVAATDSHLDYARAEASNWASARNLTVAFVPAPVTVVAVTRALQADGIDLFVAIAHGVPKGILLDKGEILDYATLTPFIRGRIPALFLNTCESEAIGEAIARDCGAALICTVGPVDDPHAYAVGTMLAYWLDAGYSFDEAALLATPLRRDGERGFKYIPSPANAALTPAQLASPDGGTFRRQASVCAV